MAVTAEASPPTAFVDSLGFEEMAAIFTRMTTKARDHHFALKKDVELAKLMLVEAESKLKAHVAWCEKMQVRLDAA